VSVCNAYAVNHNGNADNDDEGDSDEGGHAAKKQRREE
jgi:hypothetical protein